MDKQRFALTSSNPFNVYKKDSRTKGRADCGSSTDTSHTQFFRKEKYEEEVKRITTDEYFGISESISGSSDTFRCVHGRGGKQYTDKGKLKRNFQKNLDPIPVDRNWTETCPPAYGWDIAKTLEFLVKDTVAAQNIDRLHAHISDFAKTASLGYRIDILDSLCVVLDNLVETIQKRPYLRQDLILLLKNTAKPIILKSSSDVITQFHAIRNYMGFLGYLLLRMEDDELFDLVSRAVVFQLSAPDGIRGQGSVQLRHTLAAAAPVLCQTTARMLAVATAHRYTAYMSIALLLACDSVDSCIDMINENIIDNILYRFNPYFPENDLPSYETTPLDPQDVNVKLGDSSVNMSVTLSLLLVLTKTLKHYLDDNPHYCVHLPIPDHYAQRCFIWAYRYECRARERRHERNTLTVIAHVMLQCFGERLMAFSTLLMPDVMTLSVLTETPPRRDWTRSVNFNTAQMDVQFKKVLICLSVDFLKTFPYNKFMVESQLWLLGLMYLLDPGLCYLRAPWSPSLFAELRKTALQALVCTLPHMAPNLAADYGLIRRIMWYIEWYSENPYELPVLYWCVRLLQVAIHRREAPQRKQCLEDLFNTHGIIILMNLCYTLLLQKQPPVEKSQAVIALSLRLLTSAVEVNSKLSCCVYPMIKWPASINSFARKMLDIILFSLDRHYIISDRWLISLLNFIWEGIIWKKEYRDIFVAANGVYKLLDLITMSKAPVQCIALAILCDIARSGSAVSQLVTWRANLGASNAFPVVVRRGSTIASLIASVFRSECCATGVSLTENGVIENLDNPLISKYVRKELENPEFHQDKSQRTSVCLAAADLAGSRMSKAFTLLHLLSEDLEYKISLADEAYNLYKNIRLAPEDEAILVLCSHYLTVKLNETWSEIQVQSPGLVPQDEDILQEFLHVNKGWAKEIKRQQENVLEKSKKRELEEEISLYAFLGRVRLNVALDALRDVQCVARSADRTRITHATLQDAVRAHHRRYAASEKLGAPIIRTYGPPLDEQNVTGQNVKVYSIHPKTKPKPRDDLSTA